MEERIRIRILLIFTAYGLFGAAYLFKDHTFTNLALGVGALIVAAGSYIYMLHRTRHAQLPSLRFVLLTALFLRIVALPIPILWDDLFYRSLWNGWVFATGINPFLHVPSSDLLIAHQSSTLYDLIRQVHAHTSTSPLYQLVTTPFGWLFDRAGLSTAILSLKASSILLDLGIIALLRNILHQKEKQAAPLLLYAWNPVLILFITSQGLLLQLPVLLFLLFYKSWLAGNQKLGGICWGGMMLSTPVGWLGLPYLGRRIGFRRLWIPIAVFVLFWIPFFDPSLLSEVLKGFRDAWQYPDPQLTLGYLAVFGLSKLGTIPAWTWTASVAGVLFLFSIIDAYSHPPLQTDKLLRQLLILGLLYFLLTPSLLIGLIAVLLAINSLRDQNLVASGLLSCWYLLEYWFFVNAGWTPVIISFGVLIVAAGFILMFPENKIAKWVVK